MIVAIWHMLTKNAAFNDLGGDYYVKRDPERALRRMVKHANSLGYTIRFEPTTETPA